MHGVLIDLDGVIWESDKVVPGAPQARAINPNSTHCGYAVASCQC